MSIAHQSVAINSSPILEGYFWPQWACKLTGISCCGFGGRDFCPAIMNLYKIMYISNDFWEMGIKMSTGNFYTFFWWTLLSLLCSVGLCILTEIASYLIFFRYAFMITQQNNCWWSLKLGRPSPPYQHYLNLWID